MLKMLKGYLVQYRKSLVLLVVNTIILSLITVAPVKLTQIIIDKGFIEKDFKVIIICTISLLVLYIGKFILSFIVNKIFIESGQKIISLMRRDLYNRVLLFPLEYFTENDSIYINERIQEVNNLSGLFTPQIINCIIQGIEFSFTVCILLEINSLMVLLLLIPIPFFFYMSKKMFNEFAKLNEKSLEEGAIYSSKVNETIRGIEEIKLSTTEDKEIEKIINYDEALLQKQTKQLLSLRKNTEIITLFISIIPILLYIIGGIFYFNNSITLGGIISFNLYIGKLYAPFISFSSLLLFLSPVIVSFKRIQEHFFNNNYNFENSGTIIVSKVNDIKFSKVYFSYKKSKQVFKNININLNTSKVYKLVGENGSGKTTFIKLLLGLYEPSNGNIYINSKSLKRINKVNYRNKISVISQKNFLYNDTIKKNILYGQNEINEKKYKDLLNIFNLTKILSGLDITEDTQIGENGVKLSGGEIKKICILRGLMKEADIYVFDESFNNLDLTSKNNLKEYISKMLKDKLVIIIKHIDIVDDIVDEVIDLNSFE